MLYIDQFVYSNKMRTSHPFERFAFAMITMIIALMVDKPFIHISIVAIMIGLLVFRAKIAVAVILKLFSLPLGFLIIGLITIALNISFTDADMMFSIKIGNYFLGATAASLALASKTLLTSISCVACLYFLVLTTPMIEIINVLQFLRLPPLFIELMMLVYRFIFVLIETAFYIYTSQSSRWGYSSFKRSIISFGLLFANLWGKAYIKSQSLFTSLLSRGYEGELKVINPKYTFSKLNIVIFSLIDLSLIGMALI